MRILVCGDRDWKSKKTIKLHLLKYSISGAVVIHGACRGADLLADEVARELRMTVLPFPADWFKYGKPAGVIRNTQMLREGKPDLVLAFHTNIDASRGTKNMIGQAKKKGVPVILFEKE